MNAPQLKCSVDGCQRNNFAKSYCQMHYDRVAKYGEPGQAMPMQKQPRGIKCSVEDCGNKSKGTGLCGMHYSRKRKTGVIGTAKLIRRPMGDGSINETGYKKIQVNGRQMFEHRHVMEKILGRSLRPGENVHHKNGNKLDNDPVNLELWLTLQPSGQRVSDLIDYAIKLLSLYPEVASTKGRIMIGKDNNVLTIPDVLNGLLSSVA